MPKVVSFVGRSNSGKTTVVSKVVAELKTRGLKVGVIKHAHHGFDLDREGSDSATYGNAGADAVMLASPQGMALLRPDPSDKDLDRLIAFMSDMDLVITEGFKQTDKPKIEVYRATLSEPPLFERLNNCVAVISDEPLATNLPRMSPSDVAGIANYIVSAILGLS